MTASATDQPTRTAAELDHDAYQLRRLVIKMLAEAGSGHSAGPLGMAEIFAVLYCRVLRHDPDDPAWPERDILLLSNGHTAPILYAAMAYSGYFSLRELCTLRRHGSRLQGHPERQSLPGLESTSGPLGSGLSQGAGYAHTLKHWDHDASRFVYVVMGDGELNEGNIWEAAMYASKYQLGQLVGIVDRNRIQIDGDTEDVMPLGDLAGKWAAFGWHVLECDGHSTAALLDVLSQEVGDTPGWWLT